MLIPKRVLITLDIFYYIPKHPTLISEFVLQDEDVYPTFQRAHRFLNHWKDNIDAVIKEIDFAYSVNGSWKRVEFEGKL